MANYDTNKLSTSSSTTSMNHLIQTDVPLKEKNWFRTGGNARFFSEPKTIEAFQQALTFARQNNLPIFILGEGANILISDDGFDGLIIKPELHKISHESLDNQYALVSAGAGVSMNNLITYCLNNNLLGLEEFSGIPGTVGGAVYINLHYFEFLLEHFLVDAQVINKETSIVQHINTSWFNFDYNYSTLHKDDYYLVSARFKLKKGSDLAVAYAKGRRAEITRHRTKRYPSSHTCGSFFRNFHEHEVNLEINGKKMIYIAYYLDKIGVKGALHIGNASVSYQHANMIVNQGHATTQDIINLAKKMQELVKTQFGIVPQPECRLIGFKQHPLHK